MLNNLRTFALLFCLLWPSALVPNLCLANAQGDPTKEDSIGEYFPEFNGLPIYRIDVHGLKRSKERVVRWMLGGKEGESFDAKRWRHGVEHLYETDAIFEIHSDIRVVQVLDQKQLEIDVNLEDKWTLFPYFLFQGGGGSKYFEAGVFDRNLGGGFTYLALDEQYLDGAYSYEIDYQQRWVMGSDFSFGGNISKIRSPINFQEINGVTRENFTWARNQFQFMLAKHNGEKFHLETYLTYYKDSLQKSGSLVNQNIFPDQQYSVNPVLKLGKISHGEYIEEGHEFTLNTRLANSFSKERENHGFSVSWKNIHYLPSSKNLGYFFSAGTMKSAPLAYQYRLGGFDSIRGYSTNRLFGLSYFRMNMEYRDLVTSFRIGFLDIGKVVIQGCAFTDVGTTWQTAQLDANGASLQQRGTGFLSSAGLGLRFILLSFSGAVTRVDFARTISPNEGIGASFGVAQFF